jgi:protein Hikeshi
MSGPLFGIVAAGNPLQTEPTSVPSQTSFLYSLPTTRSFSHVTVFLLPGVVLPADAAAAIYLATAQDVAAAAAAGQTPNFWFLGGVGPGKESAVFKISNEMSGAGVVVGISVENAESVAARIQELSSSKATAGVQKPDQSTTVVLAQRIIKNAFNFLTGFSGTAGPGGVEVVPLKAFEDWWRKFEGRVRSDPTFLEREDA